MNKIPIAFAFDNNLVFPACVCLSSLMMHAKKETFYDIFIIHSESVALNHKEIDRIPAIYTNCKISYRKIDNTFDRSYEVRGITVSTYYRLLIPELIPEYHKIIYSDVDVIFRDDLSEMYLNTDMTNCYIAGVNSLSHLKEDTRLYYQNILKLDPYNVIYAGNIIINSELILKDNIISSFKEHIHRKYKFQDLDIINIVCKNHIEYLAPSFCLTTDIAEYASSNRDVLYELWSDEDINCALNQGIVHYKGQ